MAAVVAPLPAVAEAEAPVFVVEAWVEVVEADFGEAAAYACAVGFEGVAPCTALITNAVVAPTAPPIATPTSMHSRLTGASLLRLRRGPSATPTVPCPVVQAPPPSSSLPVLVGEDGDGRLPTRSAECEAHQSLPRGLLRRPVRRGQRRDTPDRRPLRAFFWTSTGFWSTEARLAGRRVKAEPSGTPQRSRLGVHRACLSALPPAARPGGHARREDPCYLTA